MSMVPIFPEEEFDIVICGTGLKECILSGLLSKFGGLKVLHLDRNRYYGGDCASLNISTLYEKFKGTSSYPPKFGENRDWNIDLIPKFVLAGGKLVEILIKTNVSQYLEWLSVENVYVYQYQKASFFSSEKKIHPIPAAKADALKSPLLSLTEKYRVLNFMGFAINFEENNPKTWQGFNPSRTTMKEVYDHYSLGPNSIDFIGHTVALHQNDSYINDPMLVTMKKINLYYRSFTIYGNTPFIYPLYGLQCLPESFSRLCAINNGVFMLNKSIDGFEYDSEGKIAGIRASSGETVKCKKVLCDPSYILSAGETAQKSKIKKTGEIIRCICLLKDDIPDTNHAKSLQIIFPQKQIQRQNDIYLLMVSNTHQVSSKNYRIAIITTVRENPSVTPEKEIAVALDVLQNTVEERFIHITDYYEPLDDGTKDNLFVTSSYDAESHFESATEACMKMWKSIMGYDLDLSKYQAPAPMF